MNEIFYVTAVLAVYSPSGLRYHVITNAGTSIFPRYDDLPLLARKFIDKYGNSPCQVADGIIGIYINCTDCG